VKIKRLIETPSQTVMKIRHPTAFILISWFIMTPPLINRSGVLYMQPNVAAALTEWRPMQLENGTILDSERTCEDFRSTIISKVKSLLVNAPPDLAKMPLDKSESSGNWVFALGVINSRCIASDDPRIQAK